MTIRRLVLGVVCLLLSAPASSQAYELGFGLQNVQVRDRAFDEFEEGFIDDVSEYGPWRYFNVLSLRWAGEYAEGWDAVGLFQLGREGGSLSGVGSELMLLEPGAGARRTWRTPWTIEAFGQATVNVPIMRASFAGMRNTPTYWGAFPVLSGTAGASWYPKFNKKRALGLSANVGYTTPAPISFSEREGISPGDINYGGVTYGVFVVWRSDSYAPLGASNAAAKKSAVPKPDDESLRGGMLGMPTAPTDSTRVVEMPKATTDSSRHAEMPGPATDGSLQPVTGTTESSNN